RPALFAALHRLVARQGLPLHRGEPEVPYLRTLAPAVYALFGIDETYEFMARTLGEDPAPLIEAGTSSDDWLRTICDAFSLVCELPYYTSPILEDMTPAGLSRREAVHAGVARAEAMHATCARDSDIVAARAPAPRLAAMVGARALADRPRARLGAAAADIARESSLRVLPLRPLVAVQAGAGLLALGVR